MDELPPELKLQIVSYLDGTPPSIGKFTEEPNLDTWIRSNDQPLKALSLVSPKWRQVAAPHLFKYIRVHLDFLYAGLSPPTIELTGDRSSKPISEQPSTCSTGASFADVLPSLKAFQKFVSGMDLHKHITSLVIYTAKDWFDDNVFPDTLNGYRFSPRDFWIDLIPLMPCLDRLLILASSRTQASLLGLKEFEMRDAWAFDMPLKAVQIHSAPQTIYETKAKIKSSRISGGVTLMHLYHNSILDPWTWTEVSFNEGSFLEAYRTYEYFHKEPPLISRYLLTPIHHAAYRGTLRCVTYIAIFPFGSTVDDFFWSLLHFFKNPCSLHVQLAPLPDSNLIEDPERVGTAQLSDCWQELELAYQGIMKRLRRVLGEYEALNVSLFKSMDYANYDVLQQDLDRMFSPLKTFGFEEVEGGTWARA
ncbi:MAG: hypothetical protein M1821_006287 [Bathelium mastoideum]|nr:MAG: hypothetical protein M1821_006287 [Bathelium mastoideum]